MVSQKPKRIDDGKLNGEDEKKKRSKVLRNGKRKAEKSKVLAVAETSKIDKRKSKLNKKKINKERTKEVVQEYEVELDSNQQSGKPDRANAEEKRKKVGRNKNRKSRKLSDTETTEILVDNSPDDVSLGENNDGMNEKKKSKSKKKKRNKEKTKNAEHPNDVRDGPNEQNGKSKSVSGTENDASLLDDDDEVYQISSGDEDETTGMKKWINEYHDARPGVEILWQRINDFLVDYWAQKEKEREEREAEAAEGGWTVVAHHKGRKKTTDTETGITVGSVAQAAVMDKMAKKKIKQVGLNFYRFQRREAQRNEIMMLQSKFEQDKKRIQQMRAARKFRPF